MEYLKLANLETHIADGDFTRAALLEGIEAGDYRVVNLKGRWLTVSEVERHLNRTIDGETITATTPTGSPFA